MTAFADAAALIDRFDERTVRDLLSDTDIPAPEADLSTNARLTVILNAASGAILAAALAGNNYTEAELNALTGISAAWITDITCQLAFCRLARRRPQRFELEYLKSLEEPVNETLDQLRHGKRVLPIDSHLSASLPTIDGPTAVDYERMNLISSRTRNFYPNVASRLPRGRG